MITKPPLPPARRPVCDACNRPVRACICRWTRPVATEVEVVILQHPMEVAHPKGSARLLHMSLPGSQLLIGADFSDDALRALLYQPLHRKASFEEMPSRHPLLLYPETEDSATSSIREPLMPDPSSARLIVLDGTWRKSRRMLYAHPLLQTLPRLTLPEPPPSRYRIRQAYRPNQISTLEATCHALARLEEDELKYQPLLAAFDSFVDAQQDWFSGNREKRPASPD